MSFLGCDLALTSEQRQCKKALKEAIAEAENILDSMTKIVSNKDNYDQGRLKLEAQTSFDQLEAEGEQLEDDDKNGINEICNDIAEAETIDDIAAFIPLIVRGFKVEEKKEKVYINMCENMIKTGLSESDLVSNHPCRYRVECVERESVPITTEDTPKKSEGVFSWLPWVDDFVSQPKARCKTLKLREK